MAALVGTTLAWRSTVLDRVWILNKAAYRQLSPAGKSVGALFFLLSATLATAAMGWFTRRPWGWGFAVAIISVQVTGDLVSLVRGDFLRGGAGLPIAGALLLYLLQPKVRNMFHSPTSANSVGSTRR
jgi:hypothetical protein